MKKHYERRPQQSKRPVYPKDIGLTVTVRDGNVESALRVLKKKVKRDGLIETIKDKQFFETRTEKRRIQKNTAIRRRKRQEWKVKEEMAMHKRGFRSPSL
jgi:small subunit ribosomal protein S21|tara:strand:+ start:120 stop:419 length:300 start_codon:yes stop_codon:yes gene_type:complete